MAKLLREFYELCEGGVCQDLLTESEKRFVRDGGMMLTGKLQEADVQNGNGRVYPRKIMEREVQKYKALVEDNRALGELDHPDSSIINLVNVSHMITEVWMDGSSVMGKCKVLNTPSGQILRALVDSGVKIGISSRGMGSVTERMGKTIVEDDFQLICFDIVSEPSTPNAFMGLQESKLVNEQVTKNNKIINLMNEIVGEIKMQATEQEVSSLIEEEINEIFGFGKKKKSSKEYPATELTTLLGILRNASRKSGVKFKGKKGALVDEFEKILASDGFKLNEADERVFIGKDGNIAFDSKVAPVLTNFLTTLKSESPDVFSALAKQMNNYRFAMPDELAAVSSSDSSSSPATTPATTATTPTAPTASDDTMPISGTEFLTMQYIANQNGTDILKAIRSGVANIGAAAKDPQSQQMVKSFNKQFFPAVVKMTKNPNIDIAEGIDMGLFLEEILAEQGTPLTKRQQAQKKGKVRGRLGAAAYFKSRGGKAPLIVRQIAKSLKTALLKNVDAQADGILYDAAAETSDKIKDPKQKKEYEKLYMKMLTKNPNKRLENYKQNVDAFIQAVLKIATDAAATVDTSASSRRRIPESVNENIYIDRWKVLSGIK